MDDFRAHNVSSNIGGLTSCRSPGPGERSDVSRPIRAFPPASGRAMWEFWIADWRSQIADRRSAFNQKSAIENPKSHSCPYTARRNNKLASGFALAAERECHPEPQNESKLLPDSGCCRRCAKLRQRARPRGNAGIQPKDQSRDQSPGSQHEA